jgi:hypothetical protein
MPQLDMFLWFFNLLIFVSFFLLSYYFFLYFFLINFAKLFFFRKLYFLILNSTKYELEFKNLLVLKNSFYVNKYIISITKLLDFNKKLVTLILLDKFYWELLFFAKNFFLGRTPFFLDFEFISYQINLNEKSLFLKLLNK